MIIIKIDSQPGDLELLEIRLKTLDSVGPNQTPCLQLVFSENTRKHLVDEWLQQIGISTTDSLGSFRFQYRVDGPTFRYKLHVGLIIQALLSEGVIKTVEDKLALQTFYEDLTENPRLSYAFWAFERPAEILYKDILCYLNAHQGAGLGREWLYRCIENALLTTLDFGVWLNDMGNTLLHSAVIAGCHDQLTLLYRLPLFQEIPINKKNHLAQTPLHLALLALGDNVVQRDAVVRFLLEKGAQFDIADQTGKTAIDYAVESKDDVLQSMFAEIGSLRQTKRGP